MHCIVGYAMFLDDEIAAAQTRRSEARWGLYLAVAALAACIIMIAGLMAQATAEAALLQRAVHVPSLDISTATQQAPETGAGHHG